MQVTAVGGTTSDTGADDYAFIEPPATQIERGESERGWDRRQIREQRRGRQRGRALCCIHQLERLGCARVLFDSDNVFRLDRETGDLELASVKQYWRQHHEQLLSGRECGRKVRDLRFLLERSGMGDTNGDSDIFVRDMLTGVTERVSVSSAGGEATVMVMALVDQR